MHATREIQESLTGAVDEGMKMLQSFVNGTLTEGNNRDFYGPITQSKLKTFEDLTRKTKLKCRSGKVLHVHISPELVHRRVLVLATCRDDITIENVLSNRTDSNYPFSTRMVQCVKRIKPIYVMY